MEFKAFKMDGLGNDFVIIDQRNDQFELSNDQIKKICDRNFIGCDQLIFIKKNKSTDAGIEFYNSDGSTSGACGNGTRCVAYLLSKEMNKDQIVLWTKSGNLESKILGEKLVETKLDPAKTNWKEIPLIRELDTKNLNYKIIDKNNKEHIGGTVVNVGNPHIIFFVSNIEDFDLEKIGPEIENDNLFPKKCNVTLAKIINDSLIKVKVWERGAGLTKACGTAACATAYAAKINDKVKNKIQIEFELGKLTIFIDKNENILMNGPVSNINQINIKI
jgi:diaminopimelate epimerase